ncbi:GTP-binding protein Di-Ras2-like [Pollicipes pollicipes]|uniref:GTP-binding protein Di-Ras2-like n=1 Tax=Pollicipes pollicipes TaxID=41117 RepID=UPI0018851C1D|nr:GTP-binding protein Di-Ras2-like [Pollicipes pollicipes]
MPGGDDGIKCLADLICGSVTMSADTGHHVRLLVLGGPQVGKTCICRRFLHNEFDERYKPTLEEQYSRTYQMSGTRLRVDILDTCGDNSFPAMRRVSIVNAQAIMLVYSVDSYASFLQAIDVFAEIRELRDDFREIPTFLVGNKSDVAALHREVSSRTASSWFYSKMSRNRGRFTECSALTGTNVADIFHVYLVLAGIPLPSAGPKRQLSLRLSRKRSESPPVHLSPQRTPAQIGEAAMADECSPLSRLKPRSKSLIRRSLSKKSRSVDRRSDDCGVQ